MERYIYLSGLLDRNETLFFKVIMSDPMRFVPILYDPTVAEACLKFGHIFRRPRGMYISIHYKGRVAEILRNWPARDVRVICVSTGGRILGLGDIGANGMGIPIGKLQLYTACAGVPPGYLLPILLDIGTTNDALRADPLYLGVRQVPPPQAKFDEFVDNLYKRSKRFSPAAVSISRFEGTDAIRLLAKYRDEVTLYNDDIQGTASVSLAGVTTALAILKGKLTDQRILFLGPARPRLAQPYAGRYPNPWIPPDLRPLPGSWPSQLGDYFASVAKMDETVGTLRKTLAETGLDKNTIVMFISDHGCHFKTRNTEYKPVAA